MDFIALKEIVNTLIIDKLDHSFVYNVADEASCEIVKVMKTVIQQKCFPLNFRITSENLAQWIFNSINDYLSEFFPDIECIKVQLYEGPRSYAEVTNSEG